MITLLIKVTGFILKYAVYGMIYGVIITLIINILIQQSP